MSNLQEELEELESAEDFLTYFGIEYDAAVVHVNRLHILQRYHDYLTRAQETLPESDEALKGVHQALLKRAYQDFIESTPLQEKVFKVLKDAAGESFVAISDIEEEAS